MANMMQTLKGLTTSLQGEMKKLSVSTALVISVGFILLRWLAKVIRNVFYSANLLNSGDPLQQLVRSALYKTIFYVLAVTLLLYLSKEKYSDLGFNKHTVLKQLGFGFLFGALLFVLDIFVLSPLAERLLPKTAVEGIDMSKLFGNISYLPILILMAVFTGGFAEELWRIFELTRFEKCFGKSGLLFALIAGSMVFGVGHLYQGVDAMLSNVIEGLVYALIYLRKRSALEAVSAHATYDLIAVTLGFMLY